MLSSIPNFRILQFKLAFIQLKEITFEKFLRYRIKRDFNVTLNKDDTSAASSGVSLMTDTKRVQSRTRMFHFENRETT